jgi:hypothetical protein
LKLLKTLNSALGDNALPEAHIDEAFEVWWPKLESQLKTLPPEESKAKMHRPDRELLEELLALVRNQSRLPDSASVVSPSLRTERKFPFDLSAGSLIFEELTNAARQREVAIARITRIAPNEPETRKYLIELQAGSVIALEVSDKLPGRMIARSLVSQLENALEHLAAKGTKDA